MKHKKTVTGAVLAANRANAQSSTGPRTERGKSNTRHNALKHGILAKKVALETDEERAEFEDLFESCKVEFGPEGLLETFLVEEIATLFWKLQRALGLETQELSGLYDVRHQVDTVFHGDLKLPISEWDIPIDSSWYCERIVVRAVASKDDTNSNASRGPAVFQNQIISAVQNPQSHNGGRQSRTVRTPRHRE